MAISFLIAKILATIYLSISFGLLISRNYYKKEMVNLFESPGLRYFGGIIGIILGFLIINIHNKWVNNWTTLITIIGWGSLIKGVLLLVFPKFFAIFRPLYSAKNLNLLIFITAIMGLLFGYFGFIA
jgi:hypothetical protein